MLLILLSYLAGALTILSPCILPVLPFVFARAGQPFMKSGLPLLLGMALTFAGVATLAAVGGGWAVQANQVGRWIALAVMAVLGLTLIMPSLADRLTRPLVALGSRLTEKASAEQQSGGGVWPSFLLGVATGLLWAPCAGPILGLILTGAALQGASVGTTLLLAAYAAGAATSLAMALLIGGKVFQTMKRSLGVGEWLRKGLGVLVLIGVAAIALGLDTGLLTRLSSGGTNRIEQSLLSRFGAAQPMNAARAPLNALPVEGAMPPLTGATEWINSPPLTTEQLRGKVVLVDFWTYSCINCVRTIPYVRAWAEKYRDQGLVVIGVHTPEFAFEKSPANVRDAVRRFGVTYPVAMDNDFAIWRAFDNRYWPAHYFIDAKGNIRYHHFGEGDYEHSERVIQQLLKEAGAANVDQAVVQVRAQGAEAAATAEVASPETYVGYARAKHFVSPGGFGFDERKTYAAAPLKLNDWSLSGDWIVRSEHADLQGTGGRLAFRFKARDLHLVMGPSSMGQPVRFRIRIDGQAPGADAGVDIDAQGLGQIDSQRLYQLVRQSGGARERTFEIEFLDPGVQVFAFTFG
ncbi:cytochrome c biogenesis protein CcdA/thiol-disulfide isomerase/thioredoxin [Brevundimonas bullata]|uniref:Cytochrome c biogenesis protein CcdA/thiol-disulfide isomerase/thioredoxin n=1 Tax=Brevundimonas bullata TaxID=13160 RepID=A0A7W7N3M1_9CAUL|nr:cytochrome c biogenesis protein DipZ [Brevundimonas bullata]MBB4797387.1 cytochrome c biogenesis protein CcdA/thiol-disulfide isomerase/thioredoxin [Brevundimonas bullata]MBB6382346.1 cytochrome c biogenesis protein CcdA/thiol-disulfide isomerase/thioredoxin [Brevundimonas bullata]